MKKIIITLAALIMMGATSASAATQAQNQPKGKPATEQVTTQPTQGKKVKNNGKPTGHTYKGYPVYQGSKGGYYVIRTSKKSGNEYKQYVKPEQFDK